MVAGPITKSRLSQRQKVQVFFLLILSFTQPVMIPYFIPEVSPVFASEGGGYSNLSLDGGVSPFDKHL